MFGIDDAIAAASKLLDDGMNKIWPDPAAQASAEAVIMRAQTDAAIAQLSIGLSAIVEEAKSADKWTSRARPSFLYVMYIMILSAIPMGIVSAINPGVATHVATGLQAWLAAIPDAMWSLMTTGYLGYVVARGADKSGGVIPLLTGKKR